VEPDHVSAGTVVLVTRAKSRTETRMPVASINGIGSGDQGTPIKAVSRSDFGHSIS
jgi:hypothetical protein